MRTVTETFDLPCSPERFWQLFLDETYARALYLEELKFKGFTVLEMGESSRKLRLVPALKLPSVIDKLIGDSFAYEEHGSLDRAKNLWTWRMVQPATVSGKPKKEIVTTHGTMRAEAAGDGKCRRIDEVTIEARMFGVGGIIESTVEKELRSSWGKELPFLRKWLEK